MFEFLKTLVSVHTITLRFLTLKLDMLLALLTGQRCQSLHLIDIRNNNFTIKKKLMAYMINIEVFFKENWRFFFF